MENEVELNFGRKADYKYFCDTLQVKAKALAGDNSFSQELVSRTLLSMLPEEKHYLQFQSTASDKLKAEMDSYLQELQLYCYRFALKLTSEPELAQDIAQESIIALFMNIDKVEFIKGWLHSTVYHKTMAAIKDKINFRTLLKEMEQKQTQFNDLSNLDESALIKTIHPEQIKELLSDSDYEMYQNITKCNNLKAYSEAAGISYGTARKHSHIVRRNLKAAYLRQQGWQAKPEILTYKQYDNLRRFVHRLLEFSRNNVVHRLKRYCSKINFKEVQNCLIQITKVNDWGVRHLVENTYYLTLWDKDNWEISILMKICVPPDKAISILSSKTVKCMQRMKNEYNKKIPLHKGLIALKFDELIKYLSKP